MAGCLMPSVLLLLASAVCNEHCGRPILLCTGLTCHTPICLPAPAGSLLSHATPVLVLPDSQAAAAAELARLPAGAQSCATVLRLTAAVLRYLQQRDEEAAAVGAAADSAAQQLQLQYPPLAVERLVAAARNLLSLAERARWPALAALLLPLAAADGWSPAPQAAVLPAQGAAELAEQAGPATTGSGKAGQEFTKPSSSGGDKGGAGSSSSKGAAPDAPAHAAFAGVLPGDRLRRVMHPAVLGATTVLVAGALVGVGIALVGGYLP